MKTIVLHWISQDDLSKGYAFKDFENKLDKYLKIKSIEPVKIFTCNSINCNIKKTIKEIANYLRSNLAEYFEIVAYKQFDFNIKEVDDVYKQLQEKEQLRFVFLHHPCFIEPSNFSAVIWRYLDLPKFLDLIQNQELFFTRADKMREIDKFEGSYLTQHSMNLNSKLLNENIDMNLTAKNFNLREFAKLDLQMYEYHEKFTINETFVNCWHLSDYESMAMWKIYSNIFGMAIQSNYTNLCNSFIDNKWTHYDTRNSIYIGKVNYIDRLKTAIPSGNTFFPFLYKSIGYQFEQEMRCIISTMGLDKEAKNPDFIRVKVDLDQLISNIYLHPSAPDWYRKNIVQLCTQHGINEAKIRNSNLS